ncbi:hypothetical protein [Streptomyces scopuliridis]|uniref:hypothetical protein n=1 Tax=Streptomyces scopuliridis TaxID=452529 RepID=UPI0034239A45
MSVEELANVLREHLNDHPHPSIEDADAIPEDPSSIGIRCTDGTLLFIEVQVI